MSNVRVLQKLLYSGEYDELEDVVIVEGQFVEVDEAGLASRQLILGLTPEFLLMAENQIFSYKENPEVYYDTDADPHLEGLEIMSAFPLCLLELTASMKTYSIMMNYYGRKRFFEMANTRMNGDLEELWYHWLDRVDYLHEDPYGYIRAMFDRYNLPYPKYLNLKNNASRRDTVVTDKQINVIVPKPSEPVKELDKPRITTYQGKGSKYVTEKSEENTNVTKEKNSLSYKDNEGKSKLLSWIFGKKKDHSQEAKNTPVWKKKSRKQKKEKSLG